MTQSPTDEKKRDIIGAVNSLKSSELLFLWFWYLKIMPRPFQSSKHEDMHLQTMYNLLNSTVSVLFLFIKNTDLK